MEGLLSFAQAGLPPAAYREYVVSSGKSQVAKAWALGTMFAALAQLGLL